MQFQVPQFIEVEDKIFGPLTFKQFVYVAGGAGACYIFWRVLPVFVAGPLILATAGLSASLAFLQWNGRPFISALEHGFLFLIRAKLYLWSNKQKKMGQPGRIQKDIRAQKESLVYVPKLSDSKLHELAWSLDVKERMAAAENPEDGAGRVPLEARDMAI
ncbi:hypothetical protein A3F27_02645 [Candidatus Kaiserbacteria bacterium RIFCSPHIGHO2_12_FULL_53_13]|uniref:PrgI family protein n=1 Tax=Candidatus Kaiserbacteria bacterium RIFCSPHIGHO2_12_FULL_53_13 TaxID=1798502 RepID=A0A1F6E8X3_9BACT|nr:MAG: hypothetical protein A3F27_02645 [Candidatus Kaiserbacteria bacterium RIFCSPHIGHO2_12_FULL_53_13]OGG74395.1 MAG: hypothetical protein A3A37_00305 [Candidatus Kaiserbacteria bacterium RIFCSPLOWO2_01_FULL_52_36]